MVTITMLAYLNQLNAYSDRRNEEARVRKEAKQQAALEAEAQRLEPVDRQLMKVLAEIPDDIQRRDGLELATLQTRLHGRSTRHPTSANIGEVGQALRRMGYRRRRISSEAGYCARWFKP